MQKIFVVYKLDQSLVEITDEKRKEERRGEKGEKWRKKKEKVV